MFREASDGAQGFERIDRLYVKNPGDGPRLRPAGATGLPEVWEDESIPPGERVFPSDHGAVLVDLVWE